MERERDSTKLAFEKGQEYLVLSHDGKNHMVCTSSKQIRTWFLQAPLWKLKANRANFPLAQFNHCY